jgi:hypothetical protein
VNPSGRRLDSVQTDKLLHIISRVRYKRGFVILELMQMLADIRAI